MNIFGIGGAELVLIVLIMLVVAGPKRMLRWAYILGQWVGRFRRMWEDAVDVMQKEVDAAGMDVQLPKDFPTRQNMSRLIEDAAKPYAGELKQTVDELGQPLQQAINETDVTVKSAQREARKAGEVQLGAWSDPGKTQKAQTSRSAPPPAVSDFGAWTNPQSAGEAKNNEAEA